MNTQPRIVNERFQTPVRYYLHPDTSRRITVVTTCHFGKPGYYERLRTVIDSSAGDDAEVHSEGSDLVKAPDGDLTQIEQEAIAQRLRVHQATMALVADMGWVDQSRIASPSWHLIDMSTIEIVRALGAERTLRMFRSQANFFERAQRSPRAAILVRFFMTVGLMQTTKGKAGSRRSGTPTPCWSMDATGSRSMPRSRPDATSSWSGAPSTWQASTSS